MTPVVGLPFKLPLELSALIRDLLDPADIIQCTRVCRAWRSYIYRTESLYDLVTQHETHDADGSARLPIRLASRKLRSRLIDALPVIEAHYHGAAGVALEPGTCRKALLAGKYLLRQKSTWQFEIVDLVTGRCYPSPDNGSRPYKCMALTRSHVAYVQGDTVYHGRIGATPETFRCVEAWAIAGQGGTFVVLQTMKKGGREGVGLVWPGRRIFVPAKATHLLLDGDSWVIFGKEIIKPGMRRAIDEVKVVVRVGLARHVRMTTVSGEYLLDLDSLETMRLDLPSDAALWKGRVYQWQLPALIDGKQRYKAVDGRCRFIARVLVNDTFLLAWHQTDKRCNGAHLYCFDPGLKARRVPGRWLNSSV